MGLGQTARERGRLPGRAPPRHLELLLQPLVLAPQAISLNLRAPEVLAEAIDLPRLIVDDLLRLARGITRLFRDLGLTPDRSLSDKYKLLMGAGEAI
jgi:hypothetical protein